MLVPCETAALWFKELHAGFLVAHAVAYATNAVDMLRLYTSEKAELVAAAAPQPATPSVDNSLPSRRLAIWVHMATSDRESAFADRVLDATAHFAKHVQRTTRVSIGAGVDTRDFLAKVAGELSVSRATAVAETCAPLRVSIRWFDARAKQMRVEMDAIAKAPATADEALLFVQQTALRLCASHNAPVDPNLVAHIGSSVPTFAFERELHRLSLQFDSFRMGAPSKTLDAVAAADEGTCPLENTGVVVRLCDRRQGAAAVTMPSAFHGALLCIGSQRAKALAFVDSCAGEEGLRVPIGIDEEAMSLHVCAVQAEALALNQHISLYGPLGRAGEPIHAPGSWVWMESAAIRPVDARLLTTFVARPCTPDSILPRNPALHDAFRRSFQKASNLYTSLGEQSVVPTLGKRGRSSSMSSSTDETAPYCDDEGQGRQTGAVDAEDAPSSAESAFLCALRVDLRSRRTTIGEAYGFLRDAGSVDAITTMILHAAGQLGVQASLLQMLAFWEKCVCERSGVAICPERADLERLANVCMTALAAEDGVGAVRDRAAALPPQLVASPERVRRMLQVLGLTRGNHATLLRHAHSAEACFRACDAVAVGFRTGNNVVPAIVDVLDRGLATAVADESDERWASRVVDKVSHVAKLLATSSLCSSVLDRFLVSFDNESSTLCIKRVGKDCSWNASSFDEMCASRDPAVAVVQIATKGTVRVVATVVHSQHRTS